MTTLAELHRRVAEDDPVTMVTAYDSTMAGLVDDSDVDAILVGDSVGLTTLGYDGTDRVTVDEMVHHAGAVTRAVTDTVVVVDLPFGSYNTDPAAAVENANRLKKEGGADAVKLEGGREVTGAVEAITNGGIPVFGHLGVTPQTEAIEGLRGATAEDAEALLADARAVDDAGATGMVLELVASETARTITDAVEGLTVGILAGPGCDAQVVTLHDLLGLADVLPESVSGVRGNLAEEIVDHLDGFHEAVVSGEFPGETATKRMDDDRPDR
jgi:3-methyl-2-oxobutanoate hydroxymethyltransferase